MIPYGEDCPVTKNECVGHVKKRMGTRIRNKKKAEKLENKSRLTEAIIKKLTLYYDWLSEEMLILSKEWKKL